MLRGENAMKLRVYRTKKKIDEIRSNLEEEGYNLLGEKKTFTDEAIKITLFFKAKKKDQVPWLIELFDLFEINYPVDISDQYNAILIVETKKNTYLLPFGRAYALVERISERNFGLNFAERAIDPKDVNLRGVTYVQRNKMKEVTNYKRVQTSFPQASENYFYVSGKPRAENIYGSNLDCSRSVSFSKNYDLSIVDDRAQFLQLFNEIDITMEMEKITDIPRVEYISKKSDKVDKLNKKLLKTIISTDDSIAMDLNRIQVLDNSVEILGNNYQLELYINRKHKNTSEKVEIDVEKIILYVRKNIDNISTLEDVKVRIYNLDGETTSAKYLTLQDIIYCEIEYQGTVHILDNGRWGVYNKRFQELLKEKLNEIDKVVEFPEEFNIEYISESSGVNAGEGGYISEITKNKNMLKLHKRNIVESGSKIEIADIYNKETDELIAIKRGTDTSKSMYSFEQSLMSIQALSNPKDFFLKENLLRYNDRKDYPNIRETTVEKIMNCKNNTVLWLVDKERKYVYNGVNEKNLKLREFKSIMLKLKIVAWYDFSREHDYEPKLYFALDKPVKNR